MKKQEAIRAEALTRYYQVKTGGLFDRPVTLKALDGASFVIHRNQTLAVVGESGCGKSTLARVVTMIEAPTSGRFEIDGMDGTTKNKTLRQKLREQVQIVFQDPYGSLNPRKKVGSILKPSHGSARRVGTGLSFHLTRLERGPAYCR